MNKFQEEIKEFAKERDWNQFFDPKDLLLGIVEEVGEIRNLVKWEKDPERVKESLENNKEELKDNIGDIYWFLSLLANENDINIDDAISDVIESNRKRFPIDEVRGNHTNTKIGGIDKNYEKG